MTLPPGDSAASRLAGLRIGLDARRGSERGVGVATYAATLAQVLRRQGAEVERLTDGTAASNSMASTLRRWTRAATPGGRELDARQPSGDGRGWASPDLFREAQVHFNLYGRLLEVACPDPPDLMHWTYPLPLVMRGTRNLYTVHDAIPWDHPELTGIDLGRHARLLDRISRVADAVVTVSEHSREALARRLLRLQAPLLNTWQAAPEPPVTEPPLPQGLRPGGYLLFCGSVEPRKNIARIVEAHRLSGTGLPLVIAGPDGWRAGETLGAVAAGVVRLPWVERPLLVTLLRQAKALVFPSLAEGFGLPVLEAMALGTPVLTSNRGAPAEVAAYAALTVTPDDVQAIAAAIAAIATDPILGEDLRRRGLARATLFGQDAYADRLAHAYDVAMRSPRRP